MHVYSGKQKKIVLLRGLFHLSLQLAVESRVNFATISQSNQPDKPSKLGLMMNSMGSKLGLMCNSAMKSLSCAGKQMNKAAVKPKPHT